MGEIKSTLEIVMEKTKDLTLTDEERAAQTKDEMTKKVRGLIQRYLDGSIDVIRMKSEITAFPADHRDEVKELLIELCVKGFDLLKDNGPLIQILEEVAHINPEPFEVAQSFFQAEMREGYHQAQARLLGVLEEKGISGSAVVPNVDGDQEWRNELSRMQNKFKEAVSSVPKRSSSET